jgi:hypothetical protein
MAPQCTSLRVQHFKFRVPDRRDERRLCAGAPLLLHTWEKATSVGAFTLCNGTSASLNSFRDIDFDFKKRSKYLISTKWGPLEK